MPDTSKTPFTLALFAVHGMLVGCGTSPPTTSGAGTPVDVTVATQTPRSEYPPALTASAVASSAPAAPPHVGTSKACCKGQNECKGRGECKTEVNGCKGKNECRGKGGCRPATAAADCGADGAVEKACCKGMNECKGQGQCKTDDHNCKGLNSCKAKGGCAPSEC